MFAKTKKSTLAVILVSSYIILFLAVATLSVVTVRTKNKEGFTSSSRHYVSVLLIKPSVQVFVIEKDAARLTKEFRQALLEIEPYGVTIVPPPTTTTGSGPGPTACTGTGCGSDGRGGVVEVPRQRALYVEDTLTSTLSDLPLEMVTAVPYGCCYLLILGPANALPTLQEQLAIPYFSCYCTTDAGMSAMGTLARLMRMKIQAEKATPAQARAVLEGGLGPAACIAMWTDPDSDELKELIGSLAVRCLTYIDDRPGDVSTMHEELPSLSPILDLQDVDVLRFLPKASIGSGSREIERAATLMSGGVGVFSIITEEKHDAQLDALTMGMLQQLVKKLGVDLVGYNNYQDMRGGVTMSGVTKEFMEKENQQIWDTDSGEGGGGGGEDEAAGVSGVEGFEGPKTQEDTLLDKAQTPPSPPLELRPKAYPPKIWTGTPPHASWRVNPKTVVVMRAGGHAELLRIIHVQSAAKGMLDNVPVMVGDRVRLPPPTDNEEYHFVYQMSTDGGFLLSSHWIFDLRQDPPSSPDFLISRDQKTLKKKMAKRAARVKWFPGAPAIFLLQGGKVIVARYEDVGSTENELRFHIVSILPIDDAINADTSDKFEQYHPLASCSSDPLLAIRRLCLEKGGVWDRPCEIDQDCPFLNSKSGRGGCMRPAGYCEMPLGIMRKGYRGYDAVASKPICDKDDCREGGYRFLMDG